MLALVDQFPGQDDLKWPSQRHGLHGLLTDRPTPKNLLGIHFSLAEPGIKLQHHLPGCLEPGFRPPITKLVPLRIGTSGDH